MIVQEQYKFVTVLTDLNHKLILNTSSINYLSFKIDGLVLMTHQWVLLHTCYTVSQKHPTFDLL